VSEQQDDPVRLRLDGHVIVEISWDSREQLLARLDERSERRLIDDFKAAGTTRPVDLFIYKLLLRHIIDSWARETPNGFDRLPADIAELYTQVCMNIEKWKFDG
jgi:hypothetical protein